MAHTVLLLTELESHDQAEWREGVDPRAARQEDKQCVCVTTKMLWVFIYVFMCCKC